MDTLHSLMENVVYFPYCYLKRHSVGLLYPYTKTSYCYLFRKLESFAYHKGIVMSLRVSIYSLLFIYSYL